MFRGGGEYTEGEEFCLPVCTSAEHAEEIISAILRGNEYEALAFMCWRCSNYVEVTDEAGRTALHIAAASGKIRVLTWLIKKGVNLNLQDKESGYTPLHRSLYHGQLNAARHLIMHGADLDILDHEGLAPLDHILADKPLPENPSFKQERNPQINPYYEVYVWGNNLNGNLGNGDHLIQLIPARIDYLWRNCISIDKVFLGECHSIFLSEDGRVFSCGLGAGGRLGHGSEENVMIPKEIDLSIDDTLSPSRCPDNVVLYACVGVDHSVLVAKRGTIYTFGKNDYYQLGINPPPSYQLSPKAISLTMPFAKGVSAARYHSVVWSLTELYTWGYNCGQLGYRNRDNYQKTPKKLRNVKGVHFMAVASTDNAIAIASLKGDIYLMHGYTCLKIGSTLGIVKQLQITSGRIYPRVDQVDEARGKGNERRGDDIKVLVLNELQKLMLWQSVTRQFVRCCLLVGTRSINATDADFKNDKLLVVTNDLEGYESVRIIDASQERSDIPANRTPLQVLVENDPSIIFHMKKIRGAHRAMSIYCNPNGSNFCMLQTNPVCFISIPTVVTDSGFGKCLLSLLQEAKESDFICDVVFCVAGVRIPAHRFIIESNCVKLASIINSTEEIQNSLSPQKTKTGQKDDYKNVNILQVELENIHPLIFKEILKYIYIKKFDYCTPANWTSEKDTEYANILRSNEALMQFYSMIYECEEAEEDSTKEGSKSEEEDFQLLKYDPVNDARITAAYFGLNDLVKLLDNMMYDKSTCEVSWKSGHEIPENEKHEMYFVLKNCEHLYDVFIECGFEGKVISAHKCVLVMRSRYFETILRENRLEVSERRNLFLPFPYEVMETILYYLYYDKVSFSLNPEDVDFFCDVLIAADQILLEGLKYICEVTLCHLITMKNVSELIRYSDMYKAYHLQGCCVEYMSANLADLLESRSLDSVHDELINDLQLCYMENRPAIMLRTLGIPRNFPDLERLQAILTNVGVPIEEEYFNKNPNPFKSLPKREVGQEARRRKSRNKRKLRKFSRDESTDAMNKPSIESAAGHDSGNKDKPLDPTYSSNAKDEAVSNPTESDTVRGKNDTEVKSKEMHSIPDIVEYSLPEAGPSNKEKASPEINEEISSSTEDVDQPSHTSADKVSQQRRLIVLDPTREIPQENPDLEQSQSTEGNGAKPEENCETERENLSKIHPTEGGVDAPKKRKPRKKRKTKKQDKDESMETTTKLSIDSTADDNLGTKSEMLDHGSPSNMVDEAPQEESSKLTESDTKEVGGEKDEDINLKDASRDPGLENVEANLEKELINENGEQSKVPLVKEGVDAPKKRKPRKKRKTKKQDKDESMETTTKLSIDSTADDNLGTKSEMLDHGSPSNMVDEAPQEESSKLTESDTKEVGGEKDEDINLEDASRDPELENVGANLEKELKNENGEQSKVPLVMEGVDEPKKRKPRKKRKQKKRGNESTETTAKLSIDSTAIDGLETESERLDQACSSNMVDDESSKLSDSNIEVSSQKVIEINTEETHPPSDFDNSNAPIMNSKHEDKGIDEKNSSTADMHQICRTSRDKVLQQSSRAFEIDTVKKEVICRSTAHAEEVITAILRGNEAQALSFVCWRCSNYAGVADESGRTALHIASSSGKTTILKWLIKKGVDLDLKDKESGYTALHRSLYHGQLNCARCLIKHGADPYILDNEGLSALDMAMRDRTIPLIDDEEHKPGEGPVPYYEAYLWGSNTNNHLGMEDDQMLNTPSTIDYFWTGKISINKVSLGEFHSIFLSEDGRAFSCGLGEGGRLGHGSEECVKIPKQIMLSPEQASPPFTLPKHTVIGASVGQNHSILITKSGNIYTFGKNDFYQLGLNPPPHHQLSPKELQLTLILPDGVNAARYHSVAWGITDIYTWGYNCGQLGYCTESNYQITPRKIEYLKDQHFYDVASTDSAIAVLTLKYEIYLLQRNTCLKISGSLDIKKQISISGGHVDPAIIESADVNSWSDYKPVEDDLSVLIINRKNKVMIWQSSTGQFTRCSLLIGNRPIKVTDIAVGDEKLIVVTTEKEVFEVDYRIREFLKKDSVPVEEMDPKKHEWNNSSIVFDMKRVKFAHRAVSVYCDSKGSSFCMIQHNPLCFVDIPKLDKGLGFEKCLLYLFEEASDKDFICDIVFSVAGVNFPAHKYVIELNCSKLASLLYELEEPKDSSLLHPQENFINESSVRMNQKKSFVKLENIHPLIFREILKYIYTGKFDYCTPSDWSPEKDREYFQVLQNDETLMNAYRLNYKYKLMDEVYTEDDSSLTVPISEKENMPSEIPFEYDPVDDACRTAAYFGLNDLVKKLCAMKYIKDESLVCWKSDEMIPQDEKKEFCFSCLDCPHLCDVVIECCDGRVISAHKCVLVMRSKYFDIMLRRNLLERTESKHLYLPFKYKAVDGVLFYIYHDIVSFSTEPSDIEFICQILVAAGRLLVEELKSYCENALATLITMKNVSALYKFSDSQRAGKLQDSCIEFISANMAALLDSRALDILDEALLNDLQLCYWGMRPKLSDRTLAIPRIYPDLDQLQSILEEFGIPSVEEHFNKNENLQKRQLTRGAVTEEQETRKTKESTDTCNWETKFKKSGHTSFSKIKGEGCNGELLLWLLFSDDNVEEGTGQPNFNMNTHPSPIVLEENPSTSTGKYEDPPEMNEIFSKGINPNRRPFAEATQEKYPHLEQSLGSVETGGASSKEETENKNGNISRPLAMKNGESTSKKKKSGKGYKMTAMTKHTIDSDTD